MVSEAQLAPATSGTSKQHQILLVEDNLAHAELISRSFERNLYFQLSMEPTLRNARQFLKASSPDLIIVDFRLPDGNGLDLITELNGRLSCPFILMTSFGDETIAVNAMKAGAADYIIKSEHSFQGLPATSNRVLREWQLIQEKKTALEQQSRLTAILEATPDLICIADTDGYLTYLNDAGFNILGIARNADLHRIRLVDFHAPEDALLIQTEGIPYALKHGIWEHETTFVSSSGESILTSQVLITHKSEQGEIQFFSTVARDIRYIRSVEEKIEYLAYYDSLTDLPNRNELLKQLEYEIGRVNRELSYSALLFIDLDNFKYVNDSMGHQTGDLVLKAMAQRLKSIIRAQDTLARLGGDEFVIILSGLGEDSLEALNQARDVCKKLNEHISMDIQSGEMTFNLTASIGISMFSVETTSSHELLRCADTAMYQAKKSGKNQFEIFHKGMGDDVSRLLQLEHKLRKAGINNEFVLHYQARVDATGGNFCGAETLLRWNDPDQGMLYPESFLEILETSGLIIDVGEWVLSQSFTQLADWIEQGLWNHQHRMSINISARQFHHDNFLQLVYKLLDKTNVPATCIDIELTEHSLLNDVGKAIQKMDSLIKKGVTFSLDDFGTGYSSLGYLKSLPVSSLKIDKSFIQEITTSKCDQALVTSIIAIARNLELAVVAEGIETQAQMRLLRKYGCDYLQGFYCSQPQPADKFRRQLKN